VQSADFNGQKNNANSSPVNYLRRPNKKATPLESPVFLNCIFFESVGNQPLRLKSAGMSAVCAFKPPTFSLSSTSELSTSSGFIITYPKNLPVLPV